MQTRGHLTLLTLGALGIVYGDIGTSPLYALNETFYGVGSLAPTPVHAIGTASLILWMLILIVSIKYAGLVLRADSNGEGGVFALMGLLERIKAKRLPLITLLLMFSAGLLFGDSIITPAISVLSAVEGLEVLVPTLAPFVVPITILILIAIFALQRKGTHAVGSLYGPIMLLWFVSIGATGLTHLLQVPSIIPAILDPRSAAALLMSLTPAGIAALIGAAFLTMTGSEALYADLGHFGKKAIRLGWVFIVLPALALSYAGQAAYIVEGKRILAGNLFYSLVPEPFLLPMIILATLATSIASVALIFGAYSIVSQAIVLNLLPRMRVVHTSEQTEGQIYIPAVNWMLFAGSTSLVLLFRSSSNLAAAYGFAVSGVMLITTIAMYEVARRSWGWGRAAAAGVFGAFALLDALFVQANSMKFFHGGYIPFLLGCVVFSVILTWRWGRRLIRTAYNAYTESRDMEWFLDFKRRVEEGGGVLCDEGRRCAVSLERNVVYLVSRAIMTKHDKVPAKLRVYLKRRGAVPKHILLLNISQLHVPFVSDHYHVVAYGQGVVSVRARFGFMEDPDASKVLRELYENGVLPKTYERCTIETSEDELIIDASVRHWQRMKAYFFRLLLSFSVPRYRYFGLTGEAATGLSKIVIPVRLAREGVRVEVPEFALTRGGGDIDPDTHLPLMVPYAPVR